MFALDNDVCPYCSEKPGTVIILIINGELLRLFGQELIWSVRPLNGAMLALCVLYSNHLVDSEYCQRYKYTRKRKSMKGFLVELTNSLQLLFTNYNLWE